MNKYERIFTYIISHLPLHLLVFRKETEQKENGVCVNEHICDGTTFTQPICVCTSRIQYFEHIERLLLFGGWIWLLLK